jgi:sugar phosphate isomerase/epimerase
MSDWPIGLSTGSFFQRPIEETLPLIREGGFNLLEICSFPAHLNYHDNAAVSRAARMMEDLGFEPYSFHAPFADSIDISSTDVDVRRRSCEEILKAADAAATFPVRYFVIHPGPENIDLAPSGDRLERLRYAGEALGLIAEHCSRIGIGCALENKLPHLLFASMTDLLWILDSMEEAPIGVCLDTGHGQLAGDLSSIIQRLSGHLRMVHAHDNHGRGDDHFPPGTGSIDWFPVIETLSRAGFQGAIILELAGQSDTDRFFADARRARRFLRELSRRVALGNLGQRAQAD